MKNQITNLIEIDTEKFDFQGISHEEYLEFFGYRGIRKEKENLYTVTQLGTILPAVKVLCQKDNEKF